MICPNCKKDILEKVNITGVEIDYCSQCHGIWFDEDELRQIKDIKDKNINWLDIDLWKDIKKFDISRSGKLCPVCRMPFYEVRYGKSDIVVDLCGVCKGIWLDEGEMKAIIKYLKEEGDYEVMHHAIKSMSEELWEVFSGPESMREELGDVITVMKMIYYKFSAQHPFIENLIKGWLPK